MAVSQVIGLLSGIVVLAGLSVAIIYGTSTAAVLQGFGGAFSSMIKAATLR